MFSSVNIILGLRGRFYDYDFSEFKWLVYVFLGVVLFLVVKQMLGQSEDDPDD